jgi:hypothetical protein
MVGVNVFAADTDAEARRLFTSLQQQFISLRRGTPGPLPPPVDDMDEYWSPMERAGVEQALAYSVVGTPNAVEPGLKALIKATDADELMLTAQIYDHTAKAPLISNRCRSARAHGCPTRGGIGGRKDPRFPARISRYPWRDPPLPSREYPSAGNATRAIDRADAERSRCPRRSPRNPP